MEIRNKKALLGVLACAIAFGLTSCDSIAALPANYEDAVLNNEDGSATDVYDNIMGVLYDAISSGKSDKVLTEFIKIIANDQFGSYADLKKVVTENNAAAIKDFVAKHSSIYTTTSDEELATMFSTTVDAIQAERVGQFYQSIEDRINENFYNQIQSGSYSKDSKFYEERLAYAHYAELYDIKGLGVAGTEWYVGYLTPDCKKDDVSGFIHFDDGRYDDYIERAIVPEIYKELIVEQYLFDDSYSTIGRAYGRNVNIIKLTRDDKFKSVPSTMMNKFVDNFILNTDNTSVDLEFLANAWRGFDGFTAEGAIQQLSANEQLFLEGCGYVSKVFAQILDDGSVNTINYFSETQLGIILDKYILINEAARFPTEEALAAATEFTGSNAHPKEVGLKLKLAELAITDYTTDGWYVKNGGLTDLPDAIRNRLFNISVSSEIDHFDPSEMESQTKGHNYDTSKYVRYINEHYYLTPAKSESASDNPRNFVIFDSGNYYLVEVVEAVSSSKLDLDGKEGYTSIRKDEGPLFAENCARDLAHKLGTKDSYINNAYSKYIEMYSVIYHDSTIFDYFKEKFPELFD